MKEPPRGREIRAVEPLSRGGRLLRPIRLREAGWKPHDVDKRGRVRTWEKNGRVVTKYRAYKEIGLPLLNKREWARLDAMERGSRKRRAALRKAGFKPFAETAGEERRS